MIKRNYEWFTVLWVIKRNYEGFTETMKVAIILIRFLAAIRERNKNIFHLNNNYFFSNEFRDIHELKSETFSIKYLLQKILNSNSTKKTF